MRIKLKSCERFWRVSRTTQKGCCSPGCTENHLATFKKTGFCTKKAWKLRLKELGTWCLFLKIPLTLNAEYRLLRWWVSLTNKVNKKNMRGKWLFSTYHVEACWQSTKCIMWTYFSCWKRKQQAWSDDSPVVLLENLRWVPSTHMGAGNLQ